MKKILSILVFGCLFFAPLAAKQHYSLSVLGTYGYNSTWEHYGGGELRVFLPVNGNVEFEINASAQSSNVYSVGATARPFIELPVGDIFFDASMLYSCIQRNRINDYVAAFSAGYRMDYISLQLGLFTQVFGDMDINFHSTDSYSVDPFNILYRLQVNVRPQKSVWNLYFGAADYDQTQYERHWQPLFFMGGYYDLPFYNVGRKSDNMRGNIRNLRMMAEVTCKPTGMFHLDASFYGIRAKLGIAYRF